MEQTSPYRFTVYIYQTLCNLLRKQALLLLPSLWRSSFYQLAPHLEKGPEFLLGCCRWHCSIQRRHCHCCWLKKSGSDKAEIKSEYLKTYPCTYTFFWTIPWQQGGHWTPHWVLVWPCRDIFMFSATKIHLTGYLLIFLDQTAQKTWWRLCLVQHSKKQALPWRSFQANLTRMTKVKRDVRAESNGVICTKINSQRWEKPQVLADCLFCRSNSLDFTSLL